MQLRLVAIFSLVLCSFVVNSQDTTAVKSDSLKAVRRALLPNEGIVRFLVDVDNGYFEVLVNDTLLVKRYMDTLPQGNYRASIWSPGYAVQRFQFSVEAGKVNSQTLSLTHNTAKLDFENAYREYRKGFHRSASLPACMTLANTLISGGFMIAAYDIHKKIDIDIGLYSQAAVASEVYAIKERVEKNNRLYNFYRGTFYTTIGLSGAMLATTIYTALRFKKRNAEPVFEDKSPWHDRFSMGVSPFGCSFRLNLG